jgi:hypothetical protein
METCPECPFAWDAISSFEITPRITAAAERFAALLRENQDRAATRPATEVWSTLEYGGHVRDVFLNLRDRIVLGAAEDNPVPKGMHVNARVDLGLYAPDTPLVVADELAMAAALFTRTFDALPAGFDERPIFYAWPVEATRTLRWVAAQALHESEHHLADAEAQR